MGLYLALGLAIGLVMALTGAGGGILAVPLLVFVAHQGIAAAGPVGLLAVALAAGLGALLGLRAGTVRYRAALLIAAAGVPLSPLGLWLAHHSDNRLLTILFAGVLMLVTVRTFKQANAPACAADTPRPPPPCVRSSSTGRFIWTSACARVLAFTGGLAGLLSGLLGVGGGFVLVPALRRYTDLEMGSVVPTSLAVTALVSATGVAASAGSGGIAWQVALPFAGGALAGMLAGRRFAVRLAGPALQRGFALLTAMVAIGLLVKVMF